MLNGVIVSDVPFNALCNRQLPGLLYVFLEPEHCVRFELFVGSIHIPLKNRDLCTIPIVAEKVRVVGVFQYLTTQYSNPVF